MNAELPQLSEMLRSGRFLRLPSQLEMAPAFGFLGMDEL